MNQCLTDGCPARVRTKLAQVADEGVCYTCLQDKTIE